MTENGEKSLSEQVADLVKRKPQNYDVTFSVGPQKVKVDAVKILLKAASPVFEREFDQNWETGVMKEHGGSGIPLPGIDPTVFQLFINLIVSDTWSADALRSLNLSPNTVFSLLRLCQRFEIMKATKNFEAAANDFIQNMHHHQDSKEILTLSQENLESIFSSDDISLTEIEIFKCACSWAGHQCKERNIKATWTNFRKVLGSCFYQLRFPTMQFADFSKISLLTNNFLTAEEKVAIYDFIGLDEEQKTKYDKTQLTFKTNLRKSMNRLQAVADSNIQVLRLPSQFKIAPKPLLYCGLSWFNHFQVNRRVLLHGIGFLGPIDGNKYYDVTARITRHVNGTRTLDIGKLHKHILTRKGQVFHFLFDEPITIEATSYDSGWENYYCIMYSIAGAKSVLRYSGERPREETLEASGVTFNLHSSWHGKPLAELLYKII